MRARAPNAWRIAATLTLAAATAGCASPPKFSCGVPEGERCRSVSEIYRRDLARAWPERQTNEPTEQAGTRPATTPHPRPVVATVQPSDPVLETPPPLRVWVHRWVDADGDLHDETYLYLRPHGGRWLLEEAP